MSAAESQQRGVLGDLHGHGMGAAVEQSDFADHIPRAGQADLPGAIAGAAQRGCEAALDYDRHLSRIVPLPPKNLALSKRPPSRHLCKLGQSASARPSKSETVARNPINSRSDIQVTNVELEPLGGELGGQERVLGHLEPGRMVGGERLRGDNDGAGHSPTVICQPPSRSTYSLPIAYQRLTNGRSVSSISSSGGYQP